MNPVQKQTNKLKSSWENQKLEILLDISQSLHEHLNIDDLILHTVKRVREVMAAESISVILYDEKRNELVFCWSDDIPDRMKDLERIRFPADKGIAGSVFREGKPEIILDVKKDSRHYKKIDEFTSFPTKSMIAVPLWTKTKKIGVIEVVNKIRGVFSRKELDFLVKLAPIIAMALDNARVYTELDSAYKELKLIAKGKDDLITQTTKQVSLLRKEVDRRYRFDRIIGNSEPMQEVFRLCEKVIDSTATVLIEGESGTGKELFAQTIHYNSPRKTGPFVCQNCGGIPDTLLASELFGYKRGAFTSAFSDKKGLFEIGDCGTIFLDEIEEMSPAMQASLLRVLQDGEIKPLGEEQTKRVDVRLISATNKNLEASVAEGRFREDLFYRLNVFPIRLPPLRERAEDIFLLADYFIKKTAQNSDKKPKKLNRSALQCLEQYDFPGNVRELENEVKRAVILAGDEKWIKVQHLSEKIRNKTMTTSVGTDRQGTLKQMVETLERTVISETLLEYGGNKTKTAKKLGLSRYGLMKKMQRYGL